MDYLGIDIACPACRADLERRGDADTGSLRCVGCSREYPIIVGIPDLRLWADPYIGIDADRAKGMRLERECAGRTFPESVQFYYSVTEAVPPFQARRFERGLLAASDRSSASLQQWESYAPADVGSLSLLDAGCGTAPLLLHAARRYGRVVGVDVAFRWLVLARKRLSDAGVHVPLLCACAEALPFKDARFDRVVADSTIEHLRDAPRAIAEFHRVARSDAWLFVATPNRFSLGPDPHAGILWGGWLPAPVVSAYVRLKKGVPPRRTLYSRGTLRRLLEGAGFAVRAIYPPEIPAAQRDGLSAAAGILVRAHNVLVRMPFARHVVAGVGPLLHGVAARTSDAAGPRSKAATSEDASRSSGGAPSPTRQHESPVS